jgi:hypothetical protein
MRKFLKSIFFWFLTCTGCGSISDALSYFIHFIGLRRMAKANGDRLDSEWVMQQMMAVRAMEQVSE